MSLKHLRHQAFYAALSDECVERGHLLQGHGRDQPDVAFRAAYVNKDDIGAMFPDLEWSNSFLIQRQTVVKRARINIAYRRERLIEAAIQEFAYISGEQLCLGLLLSGELHIARGGDVVVPINSADELAQHAAWRVPTERIRRWSGRLRGGGRGRGRLARSNSCWDSGSLRCYKAGRNQASADHAQPKKSTQQWRPPAVSE